MKGVNAVAATLVAKPAMVQRAKTVIAVIQDNSFIRMNA